MKQGVRRSKGCRTCVARRVLCDEARPACTRCSRSNLKCEGYPEKTIFLISTADHFQSVPKQSNDRNHPVDVLFVLSPSKDECYVNFLVDRLKIRVPGDQFGFSWLSMGLTSADSQSMEYLASHTLAQAFFAQCHRLPEVTRTAELAYGKILRGLLERMDAGQSMHEVSLLLVILTSAVYETVMRDGHGIGWMAHSRGMAQVIQVIGPRAFQQGSMLSMFEAARGFIVAEGMVNKHAVFLEQKEWKTRPNSLRNRIMKVSLVDICCSLPGLAADRTRFHRSGGKNRAAMTTNATEIMDNLLSWRWKWEVAHSGCVTEQRTNGTSLFLNENGRPLSSTYFLFPNTDLASDITSYDAALIYVLVVVEELFGPGWTTSVEVRKPFGISEEHSGAPLLLPCDLTGVSEIVSEMIRTLEGQICNPTTVPAEAFRLLLPLLVASQALGRDSWEFGCISRVREEMAKITGFAAFVSGQQDPTVCGLSFTAT